MFRTLLIGLVLSVGSLTAAPPEDASDDDAFEYYLGEFLTYEMDVKHPMAILIANRLAEAVFSTSKRAIFYGRIDRLRSAIKEHPAKYRRLVDLDRRLTKAFSIRIKEAKKKRLYYAIGGSAIGAVVAIPLGRIIGSQFSQIGSKALWIAIPTGALAAGGLGFLLGNLLHVPDYSYEAGSLIEDLELLYEEMEELDLN